MEKLIGEVCKLVVNGPKSAGRYSTLKYAVMLLLPSLLAHHLKLY